MRHIEAELAWGARADAGWKSRQGAPSPKAKAQNAARRTMIRFIEYNSGGGGVRQLPDKQRS